MHISVQTNCKTSDHMEDDYDVTEMIYFYVLFPLCTQLGQNDQSSQYIFQEVSDLIALIFVSDARPTEVLWMCMSVFAQPLLLFSLNLLIT